MKPTEKQIEEIADNLDSGMRCFYNLKSGEIKTILISTVGLVLTKNLGRRN